MTSSEFVIWLKGFTEACNDFAPTPEQWDKIKDELNNVSDKVLELYPAQQNSYKDPYTPPYHVGDFPGLLNPYSSGTGVINPKNGSVFTSSSQATTILGQTGTTRYDLTNLPSGTNITYTTFKQQLND
jgi:hypothetical protein